jgi:hypothetical protein
VGVEAPPRADIVVPAIGVAMLGLSAAQVAAGPGRWPGGPEYAVAVCAAGVGLALVCFAQLRRARAANPGQSWWRLLLDELVPLGVAAVWLSVWLAIPAESRDAILRSAREAFELIHLARGHP